MRILVFFGVGLSLIAAPAWADDATGTAASVQSRYDETRDLSAAFTQEMRIQAGGQVLRSKGKMYFEKPGLMRWEYESPEPQTIVADGTYLWIHQPEDNQVLRAPLQQAFQSQTPVSFLFGVARIGRDFEPKLLDEAEDGGLRIELRPKAEEGGSLGLLILEVDPDSYDLRAATVKDPLGNLTEVRLVDAVRNEGVDSDLFRFRRPPGTDIIEAPGG